MSGNLTLAMINNATLLLALSIIYEIRYIFNIRNKQLSQVLSGILIGLIGIAIMSLSYTLMPGLIFDTRSVLIGVAALMFGFIPGSVAAGLAILYRIWMGGIGMPTGIAVILCAYALGLIWRRYVGTYRSRFRWLKLYVFGICVHLAMLACMLLMPSETAMNTIGQIAVPVLVIYPIGVVLLSLFLLRQVEYREATQVAAEAEARYKSLFYNNHAVMLLIDTESGMILDASPAAERFYGWSLDELKTMHIRQINTLSPEKLQAEMESSITNKRNYFLFKHNRAAGGPVDVEVYSGPIEYNGKKYLYSIVHDISKRTAAIRALQKSEARFRTLVDNAPDAIFEIVDHRFVFINKAGLKLLGAATPEELLGTVALDIMHPDYRPGATAYVEKLKDNEIPPYSSERAYIRRDGSIVYVDAVGAVVPYGDKVETLVFARDISERRAALKALQESEARFRTLVDNAPDAIFEIVDKRFAFVNKAGLKLLGAEKPEELLGKPGIDVIHPDFREDITDYMQALRNQEIVPHSRERAYVRSDKSVVYVDAVTAFIPYGDTTGALVFARDISERRAALKALQESEARFRTLVDNAPDAIFLLADKRFAFINKAGLKLLGAESQEQLLGQPGLSIVHPDYRDTAVRDRAALHKGLMQPTPLERVYIRLDGSLVNVDVIVVPDLFNDASNDIVFARDLTEKKRLERKEQELAAQLRQQQKLEAIGTLAGGVAHEINNPLNGVMNYAQLILDRTNRDSSDSDRAGDCGGVAEYAGEIIHETERISAIVKNLLQFSRHDKQSHSYASIYDIVGQTVSLVKTIIKKDQIVLDIALDADLPEIKCRSQQIQQVIMNLLTNARDAVNEKYPGYNENKIIRLGCSEFVSDGRRWMRLHVTDHGCGIPTEVRDRIFEPFFSTKPKDLGTGLGLSISYGIVNEHHGRITFESELGTYTKFIVELPIDNGWTLDQKGWESD